MDHTIWKVVGNWRRITKNVWWKLKKRFANTCKFSNHDISNFILLLQKGVYLYEYMDDWEIINEISLPEKGDFKINLNMEDVTDADYRHAKKFAKILK